MPTEIEKVVQLACSALRKNESCRRGVCRRYGYCLPPRVPGDRRLFRCPFDSSGDWPRRHAVVQQLAERLIKAGEAGCAARGVPSRFAPGPAPDHLDLTRPIDIPALASIAVVSEAHFIRTFKSVFGETPHRYLQRRRVERAMFLLRTTERPVTDICFETGFGSLGTFSRTFSAIVGESPTAYRQRGVVHPVPSCFAMAWTRPSTHTAP